MPVAHFKSQFLDRYMELSKDKVSNVRRQCAVASLKIRPYFDQDVDLSLSIMDMMHRLA